MRIYILLFFTFITVNYSSAAHHDDKASNEEPAEITAQIHDKEIDNQDNQANKGRLKRRYKGAKYYQSYLDIVEKEQDFIKLSLDDIIAILKNPQFITDTEASVFTLMMQWLKAKQQELLGDDFSNVDNKEKLLFINTYLKPILDLIDFHLMSPFYLGYQVKSYLDQYGKDIYINVITNKSPHLIKRKYATNQYAIRVAFNGINNWTKEEKYSSNKTLINGLYFYVFLTGRGGKIAAYVRCVGEDYNKKNTLPVKILLSIISNEGVITRRFDEITTVFTSYDRSMGLMITKGDETFDDVINNRTLIAKNNTLIIEAGIKLLDKIPSPISDINEFPLGYPYEGTTQENIKSIPPKLMRAILERKLYILNEDDLLVIVEEWIQSQNLDDNDDIKFCKSFSHNLKTNMETSPLPYGNIRELYSAWMNIKNDPQSFINNLQDDYDITIFTDKLTSLLNFPYFASDSEESIIYLVLDYIKLISAKIHNPKRVNILGLLDSIKWDHADPLYIIYSRAIVENINNTCLTEYYDKEIKKREAINNILIAPAEDVNEYYRKLENIKNNLMSKNERPKIISSNQIGFRSIFLNVSQYNKQDKYYSSSVLMHGYEFSYFLQAQQDQGGKYYLAGFLKANRNLVEKLYLPVKYQITIEHPVDNEGKKEKKFSPINVIFTQTNKPFGGKLTIKGEDFDDIIQHRSPMVDKVNDTITVIIMIDFDVNPKDCVAPYSLSKT